MSSYEESEGSSANPRSSAITNGQSSSTLNRIVCPGVTENRSSPVMHNFAIDQDHTSFKNDKLQFAHDACSFDNEIDSMQFSPDSSFIVRSFTPTADIHPENKENHSVHMDITNVFGDTDDRSKAKPFSEKNTQISMDITQYHDRQISTSSLSISDASLNYVADLPAICTSSESSESLDFTLPNGLKCELTNQSSNRTVCGEHLMDLTGLAKPTQSAIQSSKRKSTYKEVRLDITEAAPVKSEFLCLTLMDETRLPSIDCSDTDNDSRQADKVHTTMIADPTNKKIKNHADEVVNLTDKCCIKDHVQFAETHWKKLKISLFDSSLSDNNCSSIDGDEMSGQTTESNNTSPTDCNETTASNDKLIAVDRKSLLNDTVTTHRSDLVEKSHVARTSNLNNVAVSAEETNVKQELKVENTEVVQSAVVQCEPKSLKLSMSKTMVAEDVAEQQMSTIADELLSTSMIEDTKFDCQLMLDETPAETSPNICVDHETSQMIRNRFSVSTILSCTQLQRQRITATDLQLNWKNCHKYRDMATKRNALKYFRRKWLQKEEALAEEQTMAQIYDQNVSAPSIKFLFLNKWKDEEQT